MIGRSHPGSSGATTTDLVGVTPVAAEAFQHGDVRLVVQSFDDGSTERAADGPPSGPRSVGLTAVRLERIDRSRTSGDARSPFLALLDIARTLTLTTHLTVWLRWNGTTTPSFEAVLMVATIDDVDARETRSMAQLALNLLDAPSSPWTVTSVDASTLDLPTAGDVRFVRQTPAEHRADDRPTVPSRFRDPGPDAWNRLIASMAVSPDRLDLFVTVTPTELRPDEEREVDLVDLASADDAHRPSRLHATVENAVASYRAETSVVQVMLVGESTMPDAIVGAIASSITAPFDTVNGNGVRVVASSRELVGGGCTVDPARRPELALRMMATGRPWIGTGERHLADLVTAEELSFLFSWPRGSDGVLPGVPSLLAPGIDRTRHTDSIELGVMDDGSPLYIGVDDRRRHVIVCGSQGCGKSALVEHWAGQDLLAGRSVWVLNASVGTVSRLARAVPRGRRAAVVLFDASRPHLSHTVDLAAIGEQLPEGASSTAEAVLSADAPNTSAARVTDRGSVVLVGGSRRAPSHDVSSSLLSLLTSGAMSRDAADEVAVYLDDADRCDRVAIARLLDVAAAAGVIVHLVASDPTDLGPVGDEVIANASAIVSGRVRGPLRGMVEEELGLRSGVLAQFSDHEFAAVAVRRGSVDGPVRVTVPRPPDEPIGLPPWYLADVLSGDRTSSGHALPEFLVGFVADRLVQGELP